MKPLTLVKFNPDKLHLATATFYEGLFAAELMSKIYVFVFLGEITNMPGHGVFVGHKSGRLYSGLHTDDFVELAEDEV